VEAMARLMSLLFVEKRCRRKGDPAENGLRPRLTRSV
jgi:hypothetical protein